MTAVDADFGQRIEHVINRGKHAARPPRRLTESTKVQPDYITFPWWCWSDDTAYRRRVEWTFPNDGAVNVANTSGWSATDSGTVFPPVTPARIRSNMSAA